MTVPMVMGAGPGEGEVVDALESQESTGQAPEVGLTIARLLQFYEDIRSQPPWRSQSDRAVEYYDGNQLDAETADALQRKGMGPLIDNVIQPIINVVLGMEAKTRTDWRITADSDEWTDLAEAGSFKLHEVERETRADRACSDGYAGQIKAGIGWVEVSRNSNPFEYPYRVASVHRREMFWDWRDQDPGLDKSLYKVRKRWYDAEQAAAYVPHKREQLLAAARGDPLRYELQQERMGLSLSNSFDQVRGMTIEDIEEWALVSRHRVAFHEVWYRQWVRGYVLRVPGGEVVELNTKNPMHMVMIAQDMAKPEPAIYSKLRMSLWCGPYKVLDCPCKQNYDPYIPFWGYREDLTGVPYGLIRAMISPQDEVNARKQKLMWLLSAKRIVMDADALDQASNDISTMLEEVGRPDAVVVLNPNRVNKQGAFDVDSNFAEAKTHFEMMIHSKQAVQEVVGVFNALLGRESSSSSGVAIDSLVEQGTTALAEINDNYRFARRLVGERTWNLTREDMIGQRVDVVVEESGRKKTISLNSVMKDEQTGQEIVVNDVRRAKVKVALEDVPSTPSYRQQQLTMLAEVTKGLPPELQAAIAPFYMEATDLSKRREIAQSIRKALGIAQPETPEEAEALAEDQAFQKQVARRLAEVEITEKEAKVNLTNAQAAQIRREGVDEAEGRVQAAEKRIADIEAKAAERERALKDELAHLTRAARDGGRRGEIEREIAQINADKERDVARIQAGAKDEKGGEPGKDKPAARKSAKGGDPSTDVAALAERVAQLVESQQETQATLAQIAALLKGRAGEQPAAAA